MSDRQILIVKELAAKGDPLAKFVMGSLAEFSNDMTKAFALYLEAAKAGNAKAQFFVATCYQDGAGVARDDKEAFDWYSRSATNGDPEGQCNLGVCLLVKNTIPDDEKAAYWLKKSADQGNASGEYNYGYCLTNGRGVAADPKEGIKLILSAARKGDAVAQFNIGNMHHANGTESMATKWFQKAAAQGHKEASRMLMGPELQWLKTTSDTPLCNLLIPSSITPKPPSPRTSSPSEWIATPLPPASTFTP